MTELHSREWGRTDETGTVVVCVHGLNQNGAVFAELGERLAADGCRVIAVDLRGHGQSSKEPPWDIAAHLDDLLATLDSKGLERVVWLGHSFGARLCAAIAASEPDKVKGLVLLEPGLGVSPGNALRRAENDRLDWSFLGIDGALAAMGGSEVSPGPSLDAVRRFVASDLNKGADGRYRFSASPSSLVGAWSEMARTDPAVAEVPTLLLRCEHLSGVSREVALRYEARLGSQLTSVTVPNGHNVLWEAPTQTVSAVHGFLTRSDLLGLRVAHAVE